MRCSGNIRLVYGRPVPRDARQMIVATRRATPLAVASDGPAQRVGMKLKLVTIPAKRAAKTGYGYL